MGIVLNVLSIIGEFIGGWHLITPIDLWFLVCRSFKGSDGQCVNIAYSKSDQSE